MKAPSSTATFVSVTLPVLVATKEYVMTRPTVNDEGDVGVADFTRVSAGAGVIVIVVSDGGDVTFGPEGGVPVAVAELVTVPASASACVTTYVAVQVTRAPGSSDAAPAGHVTADRVPEPLNAPSSTVTFVSVTLPVFVTRNEYVTVSPAPVGVAGLADFATVIAGVCGAGIVTLDGGDTTDEPDAEVPVAVASLLMLPASTSAWVSA